MLQINTRPFIWVHSMILLGRWLWLYSRQPAAWLIGWMRRSPVTFKKLSQMIACIIKLSFIQHKVISLLCVKPNKMWERCGLYYVTSIGENTFTWILRYHIRVLPREVGVSYGRLGLTWVRYLGICRGRGVSSMAVTTILSCQVPCGTKFLRLPIFAIFAAIRKISSRK